MSSSLSAPATGAASAPAAADWSYQDHSLQRVSRTFALTIPQLPPALRPVVGNAYLLCRIADTIEDDPALAPGRKREQARRFVDVVRGELPPETFSAGLLPLLSPAIPAAETDLVSRTDCVIRITHSFNDRQRAALARCVAIMSEGMAHYQQSGSLRGLDDLAQMADYCYYVAGVVGEMLTELFCDYCPNMAAQRERLLRLGVSFGLGLQMTNILKDMWEDRRRGACWLPRSVFDEHGLDLESLQAGHSPAAFAAVLNRLLAVAHAHLRNALSYTLAIPPAEKGMRRFCLWALGMAVLTLRRIQDNPGFLGGQEVKISRRSVRLTVTATSLCAGSDLALRGLFGLAARPLPPAVPTAALGLEKVGVGADAAAHRVHARPA